MRAPAGLHAARALAIAPRPDVPRSDPAQYPALALLLPVGGARVLPTWGHRGFVSAGVLLERLVATLADTTAALAEEQHTQRQQQQAQLLNRVRAYIVHPCLRSFIYFIL